MTIEDFIEQRLAEDEHVARNAGGDRWAYDAMETSLANGEVYRPDQTREVRHGGGHVSLSYSYVTMDSEGLSPAVDRPEGVHIARHDPARVRRHCAALRLILKQTQDMALLDADMWWPTQCALASVWSDHPDYQSEWAAR